MQLAAVRALELLNRRTGPDPGGRSEGVVPGRDDDARVDFALEIDGDLGLLEDERPEVRQDEDVLAPRAEALLVCGGGLAELGARDGGLRDRRGPAGGGPFGEARMPPIAPPATARTAVPLGN